MGQLGKISPPPKKKKKKKNVDFQALTKLATPPPPNRPLLAADKFKEIFHFPTLLYFY